MKVFASAHELPSAVGLELGPGPWLVVDQHRIDLFAEATGDDQWIHVDPERAAASSLGGTVAHGFLTLSLIPILVRDLYRIDGLLMGLNYGLGSVRFPAPVRSGTAVRARAVIRAVDAVAGGYQLTIGVTVEAEGVAKPVCVAESLSRVYPAPA